MNTVEAIYENGVFRPIQNVDLDEGDVVKLTIRDEREKDAAELIPGLAIDLGIADMSENVDHYLYGLPKQSEA